MRAGPDDVTARGALRRSLRVSSWLGAQLLAEDVPVSVGSFSEDDTQQVPEALSLTVPVYAAGRSWDPGSDTQHPLARFGQRLNVTVELANPRGSTWDVPLGWFQVHSWAVDDVAGTVEVSALGLLQVAKEDTFRGPEQPRSGGTFVSEFRRLTPGGIPVSISDALTDRACPRSFSWDEDRLGALYDLADAWPARITVAADGTLQVLPPLGVAPVPVVTLTDGQDGVLMSAPRDDTREGVYNAVVARSSADTTDSTPVEGEFQTTTGPYAVGTYGVVRRRYASPLLGTTGAAYAAARTITESSQRQGRVIEVEMPPDPRIQRGDAVRLLWGGVPYLGWVTKAVLPLVVRRGQADPGRLTVGVPL
jgi:hypothetical protein